MNKKSVTTAAVATIVAAALIGITWGVSAWSGDGFGDAAKYDIMEEVGQHNSQGDVQDAT